MVDETTSRTGRIWLRKFVWGYKDRSYLSPTTAVGLATHRDRFGFAPVCELLTVSFRSLLDTMPGKDTITESKNYIRNRERSTMVDSESRDGSPPFDDPFSGDDVEQRIFGTVLGTREPTTASTIADTVGCDPKTARKYLRWFGELGVVTQFEGQPTTYERNDAYFEWRRIDQLAAEYTLEEIHEHVQTLTTRISDYEETYDAVDPSDVDALGVAEATGDRSIDDVYSDLTDWQTALRDREHLERARQQRAGTEREEASG